MTRSDVLSVYRRPDAVIEGEITKDLILGKFLCDPGRFSIIVKDGIVTVAGTPETIPVGHDIINAIQHMEGVIAVRDRLSYPVDTPHRPQLLPD